MSSQEHRIPLDKAMIAAKRFLGRIDNYVMKAEIAGSIRRGATTVGDIEIVAIKNPFNDIDNYYYEGHPALKVNGPRLKRVMFDGIQIDLFLTSERDYGRILAIRTGSSNFSHQELAVRWRELGWCGTRDGLRRIDECVRTKSKWELKPEYKGKETLPPIFQTEYDFFNFLKMKWVPPTERNL